MSARVMSVLETYSPTQELYSIDEAFLDFTDLYPGRQDPFAYAQQIKRSVQRQVGIPVCVGLGPTKTLAKLANFAAKKWPKTGGVVNLSDPDRREKLMKIVPVDEVWGIGRQLAQQLNGLGIQTVWDLAKQSPQKMQQRFSVVMARTIMELNGISCLDLETVAPAKQQIVCSRTFGRRLTTYGELHAAMAEFTGRACEKLRQQQSVASQVSVFIRTNGFAPHEPQYQRQASRCLVFPASDTRVILATVESLLSSVYHAGFGYYKCGVQLGDISPALAPNQLDLFDDRAGAGKVDGRVMQTVDAINRRYPKGIAVAAAWIDQNWKPRAHCLSPRYTTSWRELPIVHCR
ncbi:Y-family DNA polymerase [Methylomonas sp. UP202]|uniref:Y-family DNA polymerase n=1 Tax=Methylomonas sp. UP202 TaxID=3040943 RepID=UPI002478DAD0|nr:Y-family DNA polymerase [Methylomonas sp. UP202]WGS88695.1 Y-family DNA polymerase [Methylomonas sp. UP202]